MLFADPWFAWSSANPHEEMLHDKAAHNRDIQAHERAKDVVSASVDLAKSVRAHPEEYAPPVDRVNRT